MSLFLTLLVQLSAAQETLRQEALQRAIQESTKLSPEQQAEVLLQVLNLQKNSSGEEREVFLRNLQGLAEGIKEECPKTRLQAVMVELNPGPIQDSLRAFMLLEPKCSQAWQESARRLFAKIPPSCGECLEEFFEVSARMGSVGEYPYSSAEELIALHPDRRDRLVAEAVKSYRTAEIKAWVQHKRFVDFLQRIGSRANADLVKEGMSVAAARMKQSEGTLTNSTTTVLAGTQQGSFTDKDAAISSLSRLAEHMGSKERVLAEIGSYQEVPVGLEVTAGLQSATRKEPPAFMKLILEINRLRAFITADTTAAQIETSEVSAPVKSGLLAIRAGLSQSDEEISTFLRASKKQALVLSSPAESIVAMSAYLEAAEKTKRCEEVRWALSRMFAVAGETFRKLDPKPAKLADNYIFFLLKRSVTRALDQTREEVYASISELDEPELRAFLFVELAARLSDDRNVAATPKTSAAKNP